MLLMFYSCFCQYLASQIWSVISVSDCGVKGESERDGGTNVLFGQQYPSEALGRGMKQDGEGSSGGARTEGMGWRVGHSRESLVSPERNPF